MCPLQTPTGPLALGEVLGIAGSRTPLLPSCWMAWAGYAGSSSGQTTAGAQSHNQDRLHGREPLELCQFSQPTCMWWLFPLGLQGVPWFQAPGRAGETPGWLSAPRRDESQGVR